MREREILGVGLLALGLGGCPASENPADAFTLTVDSSEMVADAPSTSESDAATSADVGAAIDTPDPDAFVAPTDGGGPDARSSCPMDGARRRLPCECDSSRVETCSGGVWVEFSACEVECIPGTRRDTPDDEELNCSDSYAICGDDCQYGPPVFTVLPGECSLEDGDVCSLSHPLHNCRCTLSCTCVDVPDCPYMRP